MRKSFSWDENRIRETTHVQNSLFIHTGVVHCMIYLLALLKILALVLHFDLRGVNG